MISRKKYKYDSLCLARARKVSLEKLFDFFESNVNLKKKKIGKWRKSKAKIVVKYRFGSCSISVEQKGREKIRVGSKRGILVEVACTKLTRVSP